MSTSDRRYLAWVWDYHNRIHQAALADAQPLRHSVSRTYGKALARGRLGNFWSRIYVGLGAWQSRRPLLRLPRLLLLAGLCLPPGPALLSCRSKCPPADIWTIP